MIFPRHHDIGGDLVDCNSCCLVGLAQRNILQWHYTDNNLREFTVLKVRSERLIFRKYVRIKVKPIRMIVGSNNINCIHTGKFACKSSATATKSTSIFSTTFPEPPVRSANPPETSHGRGVTELVARRERLYIARGVTKTRYEVAGNTIPPLLCRALGSLTLLFIFPLVQLEITGWTVPPDPSPRGSRLNGALARAYRHPLSEGRAPSSDQYESSSKTVLFYVEQLHRG